MSRRSTRPTRMGKPVILSAEKELDLVDSIRAAAELWDKNIDDLTEKEIAVLEEAETSCHELVLGYSPLIEKMARERYSQLPEHRSTVDDFISESYIVALQCARTFNPSKGSKPMRFSSYFPRAVSSSLGRMSMRSRSLVSIPVQRMTDARKWSHTKFEMENLGISLTDEEVSEISGVDSTQQEVMGILGATSEDDLDSVIIPGGDKDTLYRENDYTELVSAIESSMSEFYTTGMMYLLGLKTGQALITRFLMSTEMGDEVGDDFDVEQFLESYSGYVNHPVIRTRLARNLNNDEEK